MPKSPKDMTEPPVRLEGRSAAFLDTTGTDVLADVLDSLQLKGRIFCRCELSAPWAIGFAPGHFSHFHIIERGTCWLRLHGERDVIPLHEGDLLLVAQGHEYQLGDEPGTPPVPLEHVAGGSARGLHAVLRHGGGGNVTNLLCGAFEFESPHAQSFLTVLPRWIRVRKDERHGNEWLDSTARFLTRETQQPEMGAAMIVTSLIDVLFVEAIRTWLRQQPPGAAGWLGALRDPSIGAALGLIHQAPEKQWTVPALSAAVGLSRSPFAAKFTALVGQPPMTYLKRWRLQLAGTLLRQQAVALSNVAERVGYESTPAFSRAFTHFFGMSPGRYRYDRPAGGSADRSAREGQVLRELGSGGSWASAATSSNGKTRHGKTPRATRHARRTGMPE
jgi:AraC-like DNA-binding protein